MRVNSSAAGSALISVTTLPTGSAPVITIFVLPGR